MIGISLPTTLGIPVGEYYNFLFAKQSNIIFHDHSLVMLLRRLFLLASLASCAFAWSCPTSLPYYAETDKGKCIRQRTVSMRSRDVSFFYSWPAKRSVNMFSSDRLHAISFVYNLKFSENTK